MQMFQLKAFVKYNNWYIPATRCNKKGFFLPVWLSDHLLQDMLYLPASQTVTLDWNGNVNFMMMEQ